MRTAFGPQQSLSGLTRLRGGTRKGVYRLTFDRGSTAVLYVWDPTESSWPAAPEEPEPFSEASGVELDEARLRFFALAQALSLIAGPLRLLDGDFADREAVRRIVETNVHRALSFVR